MTPTFSVGVSLGYGDVGADADMASGMDVLDAAHLTAQHFPGGVPALAQRMGISANTLQHKLNPANTSHHLTLKEALLLQVVADNVSVLRAMAKQLGYTCVRATPDQAGGDPLDAFAQFQFAVGELTSAAADSLKGRGAVSRNAQRRNEYKAQELIAAVGHLVSTTAARVPKVED